MTYLCMSLVILFLGFLILYNASFLEVNNNFFDKESTMSMRGFWCIIIILVHVPELFQNTIQDMLGSFAYIGVTFFFMTSAYGLKYAVSKNPSGLDHFWEKRLKKLIIPLSLVSIIVVCINSYCGISNNSIRIFRFCEWVCWLLECYFFFWIIYKSKRIKHKDTVISILVILFSLIMYLIKNYYWSTTWATELYGFVWGLMLADHRDLFLKKGVNKWWIKSIVLCVLSLGAGILYIECKSIYFIGDYLIKVVLGFLILLFIMQLTTRIKISNPVILLLGGISYEIFLSHDVVMKLLLKLHPEFDSGVFIVMTIICTIILSKVVNMISNRIFAM